MVSVSSTNLKEPAAASTGTSFHSCCLETVNQTQNINPNRTTANFFLGSPLRFRIGEPLHLANPHSSEDGTEPTLQSERPAATVTKNCLRNRIMSETTDCIYKALMTSMIRLRRGCVQARRPYQPWGTITFQSQDLGTTYQASSRRSSAVSRNGITGLISYTWSKFMQSNQSPQLGGNTGYERTYSHSTHHKIWR